RFRYLRPLSDEVRSRLIDARRYAEQTLQPLPSSRVQQLAEGSERRLVDGPDGRREYLWQRLA
ncbi:MAG TPA: two-component sensor histidine kinase, partial [Pseudomonas sp.]|nr:two-component sensor histidine kinase [Pseudomonas sp.]